MQGDVSPFPGSVAWQEPGTARAWTKVFFRELARALVWPAAVLAALLCYIAWFTLWSASVVPIVAVGALFGFTAAVYRLRNTWTMFRILRTYPWQRQSDGVRAHKARYAVFTLPDPDRPDKTVSPEEPGLFFKRWDRIVRKGFKGDLMYAGDPRFAVVVAKPGYGALGYARRPKVFDPHTTTRRRGLSPEARRRAEAIGIRVAPGRDEGRA